uniref:Uncharacterized protein n=1 Tax=Pipistrellus kuhlii TaxID=59472 RepID=A0A7J7YX75_PIPKU|nr:hypothetical protein mPipKuh1_009814 [Pipistrellus kuhlii]
MREPGRSCAWGCAPVTLSPRPSFPTKESCWAGGWFGHRRGGWRKLPGGQLCSHRRRGRPALLSGEASCLSPGCDDLGPPWGPGFDLDHQDWRGPCGEPWGRLAPSPQATPQKSVLKMEPRALPASADRREGARAGPAVGGKEGGCGGPAHALAVVPAALHASSVSQTAAAGSRAAGVHAVRLPESSRSPHGGRPLSSGEDPRSLAGLSGSCVRARVPVTARLRPPSGSRAAPVGPR